MQAVLHIICTKECILRLQTEVNVDEASAVIEFGGREYSEVIRTTRCSIRHDEKLNFYAIYRYDQLLEFFQ